MRRGLSFLAVLILMGVASHDARAAEFGTRTRHQRLQDLTAKGPKGEAQALGYETVTHSFLLPYKMTGNYTLIVRGSGKDMFAGRHVYHELSQEKIEAMQRAGTLPNPLPLARHTLFDYLFATILWWCMPVTFFFVWLFSLFGIGTSPRDETRSA